MALELQAGSFPAGRGQVYVMVDPLAPVHEEQRELLVCSDVLVGRVSNFVGYFSNLQKTEMKMYVTVSATVGLPRTRTPTVRSWNHRIMKVRKDL